MDNLQKLPTILSICSGYGGIERGIEQVIGPCRTLAYVEIESYAIANLVDKMEAGQLVPAPVWTDIKTLPLEPFRNRVDILTAGYPCQPFSTAGRRAGTEDPRHLWPHIARAISVIKPTICFFENVEGHVTLGLREVLADLVGIGYRVENDRGEPTWGIFSASEVGAPHQRKRVFITACRDTAVRYANEWAKRAQRNIESKHKEETARTMQSGCGELADSSGTGLEGRSSETLWPSRPGQEQHEWEPPRTI